MAEKPILFNGEMMRAILDGRKTVTRRVIKRKTPGLKVETTAREDDWLKNNLPDFVRFGWAKSPYGRPGDILVPRTTWAVHKDFDHLKPAELPDIHWLWYDGEKSPYGDFVAKPLAAGKSRPGRFLPKTLWSHMPKLRNTAVRVERLRDITEEDAIAEGIEPKEPKHVVSARYRFGQLWNSINEKRGYGWDSNPWVWVIEFEVCP